MYNAYGLSRKARTLVRTGLKTAKSTARKLQGKIRHR